jgi:transposase
MPMPSAREIAEAVQTALKAGRTPGDCSKAQPLNETIKLLCQQNYTGRNILRILQDQHGYDGSYSGLMRQMSALGCSAGARAREEATTVIRTFNPGDGLEVDFGDGPKVPCGNGEVTKTWFFLATLRYSRKAFIMFVPRTDTQHWLECHIACFEHLGGVPKLLVIDNLKAAVIKAGFHESRLNKSYEDMARFYGFRVDALPPRTPKLKGIVERNVRYVQTGFLNLQREFASLADLNARAAKWMEEANQRRHGTTGLVPDRVFEMQERGTLLPLPEGTFDICLYARRKVHPDGHFEYEGVKYSVPHRLTGTFVEVKVSCTQVTALHDDQVVAVHKLSNRRRGYVYDIAHIPENAAAFLEATPQRCLATAKAVGPRFHALVLHLLNETVTFNLRNVLGLCGLARKHGPRSMEACCTMLALSRAPMTMENIRRGLETGSIGKEKVARRRHSGVYRAGGLFCNTNTKQEEQDGELHRPQAAGAEAPARVHPQLARDQG